LLEFQTAWLGDLAVDPTLNKAGAALSAADEGILF